MARLRLNIDDTQTSLPIDDTTALPTNGGVLLIGTEEILYTYASDKEVTGCTRGYNSTSAASHSEGDAVELLTENVPYYSPTELRDTGAPTDNLTGVGFAETGARYTNLSNGTLYLNSGGPSSPTWVLLQAGSDEGMTQLTGDVTAGPGSGSQVATIADGVVTAAKIDSEASTMGQVLTSDGAGAATWEDSDGGAPGGNDTAIQFNNAGAFGGDETKLAFDATLNKLTMTGGYLEMNSSNYDFVLDPNNGGIAGVQSIVGPVDDTLVVSSYPGFNLDLQTQTNTDFINFKFNGHADFTMGDNGVLGMNLDGAILDFQDGTGPSGELAYISADVTGGMLVVSKSKMAIEAEAGDLTIESSGTTTVNTPGGAAEFKTSELTLTNLQLAQRMDGGILEFRSDTSSAVAFSTGDATHTHAAIYSDGNDTMRFTGDNDLSKWFFQAGYITFGLNDLGQDGDSFFTVHGETSNVGNINVVEGEMGVFTTSGSANVSLNNNTQNAIFFNNEDQSVTNSRIISTPSLMTVQSDAGELTLQSPAGDVTLAAGANGMHLQNNGVVAITPSSAPTLQFKCDDTAQIIANDAAGSALEPLIIYGSPVTVTSGSAASIFQPSGVLLLGTGTFNSPESAGIDVSTTGNVKTPVVSLLNPTTASVVGQLISSWDTDEDIGLSNISTGSLYLETSGTTHLAMAGSTDGPAGVQIRSGSWAPISAHDSALLQVDSTTQGFLPPRMDTTARDAIATPAAGLMIYNTTTNKLNVYTTAWEAVTSI